MIDILIMDDTGIKVEALRHVITNLLPHGEVKIDTAFGFQIKSFLMRLKIL